MKVKDTIFYKIIRPFIWLLFKLLYIPRVTGLENIPKEGGVVLAGNHTKWLDPVMLVALTKRPIHFLAKEELFKGKAKFIVKGMGAIPVNRKIHDKDALELSYQALEANKVIGIFPEGTINRTKDIIMPFKIGAVKMANKTNSYLVPFTITGKYKLFRRSIHLEFFKAYKVGENLDEENQKLMNIISNNLEKYQKETNHD